MKTKIFAAIMSLALGFSAVSCDDDDDYSVATGTLVKSVTTGSSDVTATSAKLNATVSGLQSQDASAYTVGFFYGNSENDLSNSITGTLDGETISAEITGLTNGQVLYYQAFVILQKTLTYKGEVKGLTTTNAKVSTADAANINSFGATLAGASTDAPADAKAGIVISASSKEEAVRAGLMVEADDVASISVSQAGLLPGATYYYAACLDLGTGKIFGSVKQFTTNPYAVDVNEQFVDLGLSTKWAKANIGADKPEQLGGLFSFGDMTAVDNSTSLNDIASDIYKTANDVAFKFYDGKATMPTADEFEELFKLCKSEWTEQDGVKGCKFTGPNGNSIFLPAAGSRTGNIVTEQGVKSLYLTGSVNPSKSDFAISYEIAAGVGAKTSTPRFQALSVRAVTVAKNQPLEKALLNKKWVLDIKTDGDTYSAESYIFPGPLAYYGTDDSWATVTNNEPTLGGDHWNWSPDFAGNTWLGPACDYGYMEFKEDGTVKIHRRVVTAGEDGGELVNYVDEDGTYKVNEADKTITLSVDVLGFSNFNNLTLDAKTNLKILSLTDESMQIAILRDPGLSGDGACQLAYQYVTQEVVDSNLAVKVALSAVDSSWAGQWGYALEKYSPLEIELDEDGVISGTATFNGSMADANVFLVDFTRLRKYFPNAMANITSIKADGVEVPFDASRVRYGDLENNGNYRVELFNQFGDTHLAGCSPFSNNETDLQQEPAISFANTLEISYVIVRDAQFPMTRDVNFVTVNSSWQGTWGTKIGSITVNYDEDSHLFSCEPQTFEFTYDAGDVDFSGGTIMTLFEIADLYGCFPAAHATLDELTIDGEPVAYDATKVLDSNECPKYRLELWNCYGSTKSDCAFGTPNGDVMESLGFTSSFKTKVTFHGLAPKPEFE
ncbi:MAG: hypothetical protein II375_00535 [Bacteroidales bacterium]|nr:hypothetical protein [Bacteroidales bacterium]